MAETMRVPALGENIDSVDVVKVFVAEGDELVLDQPVIEVETEKASVEVPSTVTGIIIELHVSVGDQLVPGDAIVTVRGAVGEPEEATVPEAPAEEVERDPEPQPAGEGRPIEGPSGSAPPPPPAEPDTMGRLVPAAPRVRRFAREVGVDITRVSGTGPGGRISIDDVKGFAKSALSASGAEAQQPAVQILPDLQAWGPVRREPMTRVRRATAANLSRAWAIVPQVTNNDLADITTLEELREMYRGRVEAAGGRLTLTAILVKVVASALKVFPQFGASIDIANEEIVFKDSVHIGVAVDTERGLLVPVIRDADTKNITRIAVELEDLAERARGRKLHPDEMVGAVFSISNLGGIGGTGFSPIVNWPEVAILGISRSSVEPRWSGSAFEPRLMLPLSLSYDHRLIDGADAARFLRWLADALEHPLLLALEG